MKKVLTTAEAVRIASLTGRKPVSLAADLATGIVPLLALAREYNGWGSTIPSAASYEVFPAVRREIDSWRQTGSGVFVAGTDSNYRPPPQLTLARELTVTIARPRKGRA